MSLSKSLLGIFLTLMAVLLGIGTGMIVKQVGDDVSITTTLFYRFWFSLPLLLAFAWYMQGRDFLRINQRRTMVMRVFFGMCGILFWFLSIRTMPFGQATALFQSAVLFVTLASPFLLGERVGIYRWSAVIIGFIGVMMITDPCAGGVSGSVIYGVLAAISGAALSILLRRLGKGDAPASVALWYNFSGAVIVTAVTLVMPGSVFVLDMTILAKLILLGVVGSFLQICFTSAYRYSEAVVVSSLRYIQMPMSGIVGYYMFAEVMSWTEIIGAGVIILSCLTIAWREVVRARDAKMDAPRNDMAS